MKFEMFVGFSVMHFFIEDGKHVIAHGLYSYQFLTFHLSIPIELRTHKYGSSDLFT